MKNLIYSRYEHSASLVLAVLVMIWFGFFVLVASGDARAADVAATPLLPPTTPGAANSANLVNSSSASLYEQLDQLKSQNAILKSRLENAELLKKINDASVGSSGVNTSKMGVIGIGINANESGAPGQQIVPALQPSSYPGALGLSAAAGRGKPQGQNANQTQTQTQAQVLMVSGTPDKMTAVIALGSGGTITARVGSVLAGVGTIKSISVNSVEVESRSNTASKGNATNTGTAGMETIWLPFASDGTGAGAGAGTGGTR